MAGDDRLKQAQDAGAELIETAMAKAEEFVRDLRNLRGGAGRQAGAAMDEIAGTGKRSTDQFLALLRREIAGQLSTLGLATRADLDALEQRLSRAGAAGTAATKDAAATKKATAKKATAKKATAKKATAKKTTAKKTAPQKPAAEKATRKATAAKAAAAPTATVTAARRDAEAAAPGEPAPPVG